MTRTEAGPYAGSAADVQRRTVRVLCASQVLGGVGVATGIAMGGLLAEQIAGTAAVAGLAVTSSVVGAALIAVPVSRIMSRSGRRPGLATGYAVAVVGAVILVLAASIGSLSMVLAGMFLFGAGTTANYQARFAAADLATPQRRGRALSLVVWATTVGAVLGPNLAAPTGRYAESLGLPSLAGPFLASALLFGLGALFVSVMLRPDPLVLARQLSVDAGVPRPARMSVRQSLHAVTSTVNGRLGLVAVVTSHAVMVAVMVLTPVHLGHGGASLTVIGLAISIHIAGMYALSPVVGWLADRLGRRQTILIGALILAVALVLSGTAPPDGVTQLGFGLFLLGLGWSFGLIAGSTLVTEAVPIGVRPDVQGATDLVMGLCAGAAGALAGPIVAGGGYGVLNATAGVLVLPLLVLAGRRRAVSPGRDTA